MGAEVIEGRVVEPLEIQIEVPAFPTVPSENVISSKAVYSRIPNAVDLANHHADMEARKLEASLNEATVKGRQMSRLEREEIICVSDPNGSRQAAEMIRQIKSGGNYNADDSSIRSDVRTNYEMGGQGSHPRAEADPRTKPTSSIPEYKSIYGEGGYQVSEYKSIYDE